MVDHIRIRGARVHNLKNVNVDVPLGKIVGVAGVSGSGKSSLALGVLYAEGSRRYLDALSTYTRRRMTQAAKASVDEVLYVPAALALHQRPAVPGIRSTFGTGTELLNSLRLMFSRLSSYPCPQCGRWLEPSLSGGEAQRLKLASEMGKGQADSVFVFDEPTIGLHPLDVQTLLGVFQKLIGNGATVVVIEHDLDVIRNADYLVDMGPGGGDAGGRIVAAGTPEQVRQNPESITGRYI